MEKDRKEKETTLEKKVSTMSDKIEVLEKILDSQEQYSRRSCLLVYGIEQKEGEQTDKVIVETVEVKMSIDTNL